MITDTGGETKPDRTVQDAKAEDQQVFSERDVRKEDGGYHCENVGALSETAAQHGTLRHTPRGDSIPSIYRGRITVSPSPHLTPFVTSCTSRKRKVLYR